MILYSKAAIATILWAAMCLQRGIAENATPTVLEIDTVNRVQYYEDTAEVSRFATAQGVTTASLPANFGPIVTVADIIAVNGQPVRGTFVNNSRMITLRPVPTPGQAMADTTRNAVENHSYEILKTDGTPIGTIIALGLGAGVAPPGAPAPATQGNNAIVGGTGAFLGVRGYVGSTTTPPPTPTRQASMTEDPANRRQTGGGTLRFVLYVVPMTRPEIVVNASGPAISHADFSSVTASKPAKAGEVLILKATGLGPTVPGVGPGQPFPLDVLLLVNSPLSVSVNGQSAEVLNSIGWPGLVDAYRVDFRVPDQTAAGMAAVRLTAAWIAGSSIDLPIQ